MKSKPATRDAYHHGALRTALLRCAFDLLAKDGPETVTIRAVARAAGVAHSAPVNHFANKRALLTALAADIFHELADQVTNTLQAGALAYPDMIRTFANTVTAYALAHPHRYNLLWRRDLLDDEDASLRSASERIYGLLVARLGDKQRRRDTSVETRAIALWSMVHGYVTLRLSGNFVEKNDEISGLPRSAAIVEALLDGIASRAQ